MTETKLRDVITSALIDAELDPDYAAADTAADVVTRRLQHADNIELDDGTLFIRRLPRTQAQADAILRSAADLMQAYGQTHVAIALIEAVGHAKLP